MKSLDVADCIIDLYGSDVVLTNLKLNKLVYFAQVLSLKKTGVPLFDDTIEAWDHGPVEPGVYRRFHPYGGRRVATAGEYERSERLLEVVHEVMSHVGGLTAFDLVRLSHRGGGAWRNVYRRHGNAVITVDAIRESSDMFVFDAIGRTLSDGIAEVDRSWPNALRMLENG